VQDFAGVVLRRACIAPREYRMARRNLHPAGCAAATRRRRSTVRCFLRACITLRCIATVMNELAELFEITVPVWEIVVRGSAVYLALFAIFRFVIRRDIGAVGIADILVLVLVADASQNAMAGGYTTITEGVILVVTLVGWNMLLDWLAFRSRTFARFVQPDPLLLIRNGKILRNNLRKEFVTVDELRAKLREHGIEDIAEVKKAYLESDGEFTVISRKKERGGPPPPSPKDKIV
jgi:uncharacterized membrane protein YcaP (DUF421 family)